MDINKDKIDKTVQFIHSEFMAEWLATMLNDELLISSGLAKSYVSEADISEMIGYSKALLDVRDRMISAGIEWPADYLRDEAMMRGCEDIEDLHRCGFIVFKDDLGKEGRNTDTTYSMVFSDIDSTDVLEDYEDEEEEAPSNAVQFGSESDSDDW